MTQEAIQIEVPNLEATLEGKRIITPKQWLEKLRQYTKRTSKLGITESLRLDEMA